MTVTSERRRAMRDRGTAIAKQTQIVLAVPAHPGMGVNEQRVAEDCSRPKQPQFFRPLDRRHAVAADHLAHLVDALRAMRREGKSALARRVAAVAQQFL